VRTNDTNAPGPANARLSWRWAGASWSSTWTLEAPQIRHWRARRVKTALSNLTANAAKYTPRESVSDAHVFGEPDRLRTRGHATIEVVVSDTGCGVPPEKPESNFQRIRAVDSSADHRAGTRPGLGA